METLKKDPQKKPGKCCREPITAFLPEELIEMLSLKQSFRGDQLFDWIHNKLQNNFLGMTNLPIKTRNRLNLNHTIYSTTVSRILEDTDGTVKFQITLPDGLKAEAVQLSDGKGRLTACISSQAGCAMGCTFCRTGSLGFRRNLTAHEIVEQYLHIQRASEKPVGNIVFMGMGEPLENLEEVERAITVFNHPKGSNIGIRKMVVSTSGIVPGIIHLADSAPPVRLAVSLITPSQDIRNQLMPGLRRYPLPELREALKYYQTHRNKRITLEIVLLKGLNDRVEDMELLKRFIGDLKVMINLIPWNPLPGFPFQEPSEEEIKQTWQRMISITGADVYVRYNKGRKITGACGQLG